MTGLEIGLAVGLGVVVVAAFGALIWGYNWGSNDEHEYMQRYKTDAESERLWAGRWRDEAAKQDKRRNKLDLGIGRAIACIVSAHSEQCDRGLKCRHDPAHYYGREYDFRAAGIREALNILEEETGRYKEVEEEPSPAYVNAQRRRQAGIDQRQHVSESQWRRPDYRQPTTRYPGLPPSGGCKVCGTGAYTYRWGQVITTWYSGNNEETTWATILWQKYDPKYDVGWFPVCAHHARVLDKYGCVSRSIHGHTRRTEETGGRPPLPRGYREC